MNAPRSPCARQPVACLFESEPFAIPALIQREPKSICELIAEDCKDFKTSGEGLKFLEGS